jgi:tetratricopeptide (TPR) repeat protein
MRRNRRSSKPAKPAVVAPSDDVDADFRSARTALSEGAFDGAIDGFRKMLEAVPNHANALSGLGNALAMSGRGVEAFKVLRQARDAARMDPMVQYEVGHGFMELRRFDDAALAFQAAVIASPSFGAALLKLSHCLVEVGRESEAKPMLERALLLEPLSAPGWYELHRAVFDDKDLHPAVDALTRAVTSDPAHRAARFAFGVALDLTGEAKAAEQQFAMVLSDKGVFGGAVDSYRYAKEHRVPSTRFFATTHRTLRFALEQTSIEGLTIELGVSHGASARFIAQADLTRTLHGFDSFQGLPEASGGLPRGAHSTRGEAPELPANVDLHVGLFADTLAPFARAHEGPIRFLHVDCDLYSATKLAFDAFVWRFIPGTIVVFDDYFVNQHWREGEFKAFQEAVQRYGWKYEYLAFSLLTGQAVVRIS